MKCSKFAGQSLEGIRGFTIIELLIVISLMMVIAVVGIASFSSFNTATRLTTAVLSVKNMLQYAKSQSINQINVCPAGQTLSGYKVVACCQGSSCPVCLSTSDYEVDTVCSGGSIFSKGEKLPTNVTFDTTNSTSFSYIFNILTGSVTGAGNLVLKQAAIQKTISVSATGVIQ